MTDLQSKNFNQLLYYLSAINTIVPIIIIMHAYAMGK